MEDILSDLDGFCPYSQRSLIPDVQVKPSGCMRFPVFICENRAHDNFQGAVNDVVDKLQYFDERNFHGLPFYLTMACTPLEAQFIVSYKEKSYRFGNPIGSKYNLKKREDRARFRLSSAEPLLY